MKCNVLSLSIFAAVSLFSIACGSKNDGAAQQLEANKEVTGTLKYFMVLDDNGKPVEGADVRVADSSAKSDADGFALIFVPDSPQTALGLASYSTSYPTRIVASGMKPIYLWTSNDAVYYMTAMAQLSGPLNGSVKSLPKAYAGDPTQVTYLGDYRSYVADTKEVKKPLVIQTFAAKKEEMKPVPVAPKDVVKEYDEKKAVVTPAPVVTKAPVVIATIAAPVVATPAPVKEEIVIVEPIATAAPEPTAAPAPVLPVIAPSAPVAGAEPAPVYQSQQLANAFPTAGSYSVTICIDGADELVWSGGSLAVNHISHTKAGLHASCPANMRTLSEGYMINGTNFISGQSLNGMTVSGVSASGRGSAIVSADRVLLDDAATNEAGVYTVNFTLSAPVTIQARTMSVPQAPAAPAAPTTQTVSFQGCIDGSQTVTVSGGWITVSGNSHANIGAHPSCNNDKGAGFYVNGTWYNASSSAPVPSGNLTGFQGGGRGTATLSGNSILIQDDDTAAGQYSFILQIQ